MEHLNKSKEELITEIAKVKNEHSLLKNLYERKLINLEKEK